MARSAARSMRRTLRPLRNEDLATRNKPRGEDRGEMSEDDAATLAARLLAHPLLASLSCRGTEVAGAGGQAERAAELCGAEQGACGHQRARVAVMAVERGLGFAPVDREFEQVGYDIESHDPTIGQLRFIDVKGRVAGAEMITVTKNEILCSLNTPDQYILAMVEFLPDGSHQVFYLRRPFVVVV